MSEERDELELRGTTVLDRTWWPARVALFTFVASVLLGFAGAGAWTFGVAFLSIMTMAFTSGKVPLAGAPHTHLMVGDDAVRSADIVVADRAQVIEGTVWPKTSHGLLVRLERKGFRRPIEIAVGTIDDGRALLERLGLDPRHAQATFRVSSPLRYVRGRVLWASATMIAGLVALGFVLSRLPMGVAAVIGMLAVPVILVAPFLSLAWPRTVRIGSDGVLVQWFGRRTLIRFEDVDSFEASAVRVRLHLRGGGDTDLVADAATCAAIAERLRPILEHRRTDVEALERRGRPVREWIASLHALSSRAEGFRDVPYDEDRLWSVLEDPRASLDAKAGAAVALSPNLDDAGKARLRVAREAIVSQKLRVALDAVDGRDADALHDALEDLDEKKARS